MKKTLPFNYQTSDLTWLSKALLLASLLFISVFAGVRAQVSGNWDSNSTTATTGYQNHGSGVIQLLNTTGSGCQAAAVHETSSTYNPTSGTTFTRCFKVFFGCPGDDNIGTATDTKGDGMAFSFWRSTDSYNINNGSACGGGLGYMGATGDPWNPATRMITIEFDTYSSRGDAQFDGSYGGGTVGNNDEIAVHYNGNAQDPYRLTSVNAGNLEDGLEHDVCITYVPGTRMLTVTIDGNSILSYNMGATYGLQDYFGNVNLNHTWSSGKYGATNPTTVSHGAGIAATIGGPLCPAGVHVTSPSPGASFGGCNTGPITITATATPPAGNTVSYVEFFVNGVSIGTDNTFPYSTTWNTPTDGSHNITARAYYVPSNTNSTSAAVPITVGGGIKQTSTAPTIDGNIDAIWGSYASMSMTQGFNSPPDLAAYYKIMYDANYLYVLVDVTDEDLRNDSGNDWEDDGVEIFIDIGNTKINFYNCANRDYQYVFEYNNGGNVSETKCGAMTGVNVGRTLRAGGYIVEARFPWTTLGGGVPAPGSYLGFDVKINDDDGGGGRDHELAWNDGSFGMWNNPSLFGTLQFLNCDPLPVSVLMFNGNRSGSSVVLNWVVNSETNGKRFIIERSVNLQDWERVGEVNGSSHLTTYSLTDFNAPGEVVYYRLVILDSNGSSSLSETIKINSGIKSVTVMPNPFEEAFTIMADVPGNMNIKIYDVLGRVIYEVSLDNQEGMLAIQPDLASGAYLLVISADGLLEQRKIIKR